MLKDTEQQGTDVLHILCTKLTHLLSKKKMWAGKELHKSKENDKLQKHVLAVKNKRDYTYCSPATLFKKTIVAAYIPEATSPE